MELVKLENLRDQIREEIGQINRFNGQSFFRHKREVSPNNSQAYLYGMQDAKIQEVKFLEKQLEFILAEIEKALELEKKFSKALGLEMVDCDCERCKAKGMAIVLGPKAAEVLGFESLSLKGLEELCFKLEDDIAEIEKKDDSDSEMKQKLDEALSKVKDMLIEFHVRDSKYCLEVHEIIEDCYRLQDEVRRIEGCYRIQDEIREDVREKKENKKYTVISFIKQACYADGGFDSLESAREHANRMLRGYSAIFKVEIREAGSNKLVANMAPTGEPKITMHECMWGKEE